MWKNRKIGDLSVSERGQIVGACLTGGSVTKTGTVLGVSRATVSKVMSACTNHGKTNINEEEQWAKIKTDRKGSSYVTRIVSKNHRNSAAQVTAELNIHLEDPVSTKCPTRASQIQRPL